MGKPPPPRVECGGGTRDPPRPTGEKAYVPIGGGAQWKTHLGSLDMNLGLQLFNNVIRPEKGTVWDLRLLVELVF